MREKISTGNNAVPESGNFDAQMEAMKQTGRAIEGKVARMSPQQKNRFAEALKDVFLPDKVTRETRGLLAGFLGIGGAYLLGAEYLSREAGQEAISAQMREAAAYLQTLPVWDNAHWLWYAVLEGAGHAPQAFTIAGAAGLASCVAGWMSDKIQRRR